MGRFSSCGAVQSDSVYGVHFCPFLVVAVAVLRRGKLKFDFLVCGGQEVEDSVCLNEAMVLWFGGEVRWFERGCLGLAAPREASWETTGLWTFTIPAKFE